VKTIPLLFWCLASAGVAQRPASNLKDPNLSCITALELPTRGLSATGARASGTVNAEIHIGSRGEVSRLDLRGGEPALQGEVQVAIGLSEFSDRCAGQTVELVFAFTLENPPTSSIIPPGVRFLPPNRFELIFRRRRPNIEEAPPPPASGKNEASQP